MARWVRDCIWSGECGGAVEEGPKAALRALHEEGVDEDLCKHQHDRVVVPVLHLQRRDVRLEAGVQGIKTSGGTRHPARDGSSRQVKGDPARQEGSRTSDGVRWREIERECV